MHYSITNVNLCGINFAGPQYFAKHLAMVELKGILEICSRIFRKWELHIPPHEFIYVKYAYLTS